MKNPEKIPKFISSFRMIAKDGIIGRREELERLRNCFSGDQKQVLLKGADGVGKTTLASFYATEFAEEYAHIAWLTAGDSLEEAMLTNIPFLTNLGLLNKSKGLRVWECLETLASIKEDKPSLLVLDDVSINLSVFYEHLPSAPHWHLLLTSKERLSRFETAEVFPLCEEDAVTLFNKHCNGLSSGQVKELVRSLEYIPLLVEFMARSYCSHQLSFEQVNPLLNDKPDKFFSPSLFGKKLAALITGMIKVVLHFSSPDERHTWLLKQFLVLPGTWTGKVSLGQLLQSDQLSWQDSFDTVLGELCQEGFLQHDPGTDSYMMHPLINESLRKILPVFTGDVLPLIEKVTHQLHDHRQDGNALLKFRNMSLGESILKAFFENTSREISTLQKNLASVYKEVGEFEKARELLEIILQNDIIRFGEKHPEVASHQAELAQVYKDLGEYEEARYLFESALQADIEHYGGNHPKVVTHHTNLAHIYKDLGDYEKARDLLEKTLKGDLERYEPTHPFISQSQSNLATIYMHLGENVKARTLLETALNATISNFGEHHASVSAARSNLAAVYRNLGENEKARDLLEIAIETDIATLGVKHPYIAVSQSVLANVHASLGEFEKARELWEMSLRSNLENFGKDHPNVALCQSNLASIYSELGDFDQARDLLEEALKSDLVNFGEKHPYVALCQSNLANVYHSMGDYATARGLFEKTLLLHKEIYEPGHPFISQVQTDLANVYADAGEFDNAVRLLENTLESELSLYGEDHPAIAVRRSNLASLYADFGENEKARILWDSAYGTLKAALGEDHPNTMAVKSCLESFRGNESRV